MKCNSVPFPGFHKIWHKYIRQLVSERLSAPNYRLVHLRVKLLYWIGNPFNPPEVGSVGYSSRTVGFNSYSPNWEVVNSTLKSRPEHFHSSLWIWAVALAWTVRKQTWDTPEYCAIEIMQNATRTPLDRQLFDNTTCSGHSIKGSGWPKTLF